MSQTKFRSLSYVAKSEVACESVAYGGQFGRVFTRLATSPKL